MGNQGHGKGTTRARQMDGDRPAWRRLLLRLLREEAGQDLIEYALLTTFIGLSSVVAWDYIESAIGNAYQSLNNEVYDLWEPPPPQP